jgi:hypothetical protein
MTSPGRIDPPQERRLLGLGEGPDTVSVVAVGRQPSLKDGAIQFAAPQDEAQVGRAVLDADLDGTGLKFLARTETTPPEPGVLAPLRHWVMGAPADARSALVLLGDPGRYVALVLSGNGAPPLLEWALGSNRRGSMSSPAISRKGATRLEISIDPKLGALSAWTGEGQDRRLVGDALHLGPGWRSLFGRMPKAAVGCLDGGCRFTAIQLLVEREPPPPPPPPVPEPVVAPPPAPVAVARPPPSQPPSKKSPAASKPKPVPQPPRKTTSHSRKR